jgi:hypothetical protein
MQKSGKPDEHVQIRVTKKAIMREIKIELITDLKNEI